MSTNAALVDAAGLTVRAALDEATRLARLRREVHEASLVLVPLVRRFRATRDLLQTAIDDKRPLTMPHEKLVEQFAVEVEKLIRLIKKQKNATLATRVVDAERLAAEIQALHGGMGDHGTCTSGLSRIHSSIGERNDEAWRRDVDTAISDYKQALREAVDTCLPDMERDPAMVREALILLEHEKKRGLLSPLGDRLWDRIRTLAPADVIEVPAWFISESDIVFTSRVFDRGGFATIHHATWDGSTVVTKVLRDADMATFVREVEIGFKLSHPHVVKIYGACHTSEPPFIVCEFAKNGNMGNYLVSHPDEKWRLLYEAALGLRFLHRNKIVHGDLKLNNILVMEDGKAKIADFGLSRRKETSKTTTLADNTSTGAIRWRAPECFKTKPTFQSDVYSFGMCVYEAVSGKVPYEDIDSLGSVEKLIRGGELPTWPADNVASSAQRLFQQMSRLEKEDRIDLESAIIELKILADEELQLKCDRAWSELSNPDCRSRKRHIELRVKDRAPATNGALCVDLQNTLGNVVTGPKAVDFSYSASDTTVFANSLVELIRDGTDADKSQATVSLTNISANSPALVAKAGAIDALLQLLKTGPYDVKCQAIQCLYNLAYTSLERSKHIADAGGIDLLISQLESGADKAKSLAASTLSCLAHFLPAACDAIASGGGFESLSRLLLSGARDAKTNATYALSNLSHNSPSAFMGKVDVITPMMRLLTTATEQEKILISGTLGNLAINSPERCVAIASAGGIVALTDILEDVSGDSQSIVATTLANLARNSPERSAELIRVGAIDQLLQVVDGGTESGKTSAAEALNAIAMSSPGNALAIVRADGVASLRRLLKTGTAYHREKARGILGVLSLLEPARGGRVENEHEKVEINGWVGESSLRIAAGKRSEGSSSTESTIKRKRLASG